MGRTRGTPSADRGAGGGGGPSAARVHGGTVPTRHRWGFSPMAKTRAGWHFQPHNNTGLARKPASEKPCGGGCGTKFDR